MSCVVYKYVYNGEIIYVGKSDSSLINRLKCHAQEAKFKPYLANCEIFYFGCQNAAQTRIYETYLIDKYKPILNEIHKYKEDSGIFIDEPFWYLYCEKQPLILSYHSSTLGLAYYKQQAEFYSNQFDRSLEIIAEDHKIMATYLKIIANYQETIHDLRLELSETQKISELYSYNQLQRPSRFIQGLFSILSLLWWQKNEKKNKRR